MKQLVVTLSLVTFLLCSLGNVALALEEPKFKNPNPTFKPIPKAEEKKLLPAKLGKPPKMTKEDKKKIAKGDIVVKKLADNGDKKEYEALAIIKASPKKIMDFMKDFPGRVGKMPHVTRMDATWNGNMAVVEQEVKVALSKYYYKLNFLFYGDSVMEWEYVHGDIKNTTGFYKLYPMKGGTKTLMVYRVFTDSGLPIPDFIINLLSKNSMPGVIEAVRKYVEK